MPIIKDDACAATWNGSKVKITSTLIPKVLWQTASIDVFVDEKCILRTGGQLKTTGSHRVQFEHAGEAHEAILSWGRGGIRSFPFELYIDGQSIAATRVFTSNWYLTLLPWTLLIGIAAWIR